MLQYERMFLPYAAGEDYYQKVNQKLEYFLDDSGCSREEILGMGISFPGIIDLEEEVVAESHILGVKALPFAFVSRFFAYPCYFLNDANAGAYAEGMRTESPARFFYLSLSNTVGGAMFGSGGLEQGMHFRCGEAGHMTIVPDGRACYCGKQGCLDAYCSARLLSDFTEGKLDEFFRELKRGNKKAAELWDNYTTYLAIAANNIHMILDCDIILGGYVGSSMGEYVQDIKEKVEKRNTFAKSSDFVKCSGYKVGAAAFGAARRVIEAFMEQV